MREMTNIVFFVLLVFLQDKLVISESTHHSSMDSYFPEVGGDYSKITWAHAVNSWSDLNSALGGDLMMLECDISLGEIVNRPLENKIPVMAHPPAVESDISFEEWIDAVIEAKKRKGVKLDFKSIEVVEPSLMILESRINQINFPVWINADIHAGPVGSTTKPVHAARFLQLCKRYFPRSVISPGWTTFLNDSTPVAVRRYDWPDVLRMAQSLRQERITQPVTFPVRAAFLGASVRQLLWLTEVIPDSTITVWSGKSDTVNVNQLLVFAEHFARQQVFYDLPSPLNDEFHKRKGAVPTVIMASTCKRGPLARLAYPEADHDPADICVLAGASTIILPRSCRVTFSFGPILGGKRALIMAGSISFLPGFEIGSSDSSISVSCVGGANASGVAISQYGKVEKFFGWKLQPFQLQAGSFGQYSKQEFRFQIEASGSDEVTVTIWDSPISDGRDFVLQCSNSDNMGKSAFRFLSHGGLPKLLSNLDFPCATFGSSVATNLSQGFICQLLCASLFFFFFYKR